MPGISALRLAPGSWPRLLQLALVLVLVVQALRLGLSLREPAHPPAFPAAADASTAPALVGHDPFFAGQGAAAAPAQADGWRLHGLRTGVDGGSAILSRGDGRQSAYFPGDTLEGDLVLEAVSADHVVLREGAQLRELALPDAPGGTTPPPATPQPGTPPEAAAGGTANPATTAAIEGGVHADIDPARLLASAGLRRLAEAGAAAGYTLLPRGDDRLVRAAGLQPGDVLLSVNGQPLDPEHLADLATRLKDDPRAVITYRRDGQVRTLTLGHSP